MARAVPDVLMGRPSAALLNDPLFSALGDTLHTAANTPSAIPAQGVGLLQGMAEGAATPTDPLSLAGFLAMGSGRSVARPLVRFTRELSDAERAFVARRLAGASVDELARLRAEVNAARSSAEIRRAVASFAHGLDVAGSAVVTPRGVHRTATADTLSDAAAGVAEAALGAHGIRSAQPIPRVAPHEPLSIHRAQDAQRVRSLRHHQRRGFGGGRAQAPDADRDNLRDNRGRNDSADGKTSQIIQEIWWAARGSNPGHPD
jgi:hypothetical protein